MKNRFTCEYNIVLRPHTLDKGMIIPKDKVSMSKWIVTNKNLMFVAPDFDKKGQVTMGKINWSN